MKIDQITREHGSDFSAVLICEHCFNRQDLTTGYHDNHYHAKVIPAITCERCLKNRAGEVPAVPNPKGMVAVL